MKTAGVLLLAALAAVVVAGDVLVRVELKSDADIGAASALGVTFLDRFDGWCLARADRAGLARLTERFDCTVLDQDPATKRYVFVFVKPGFDRVRLAEFGTGLTEDKTGVLLRTDEDGVLGLNRLPVELYAVSMRPMYLGETASLASRIPDRRTVSDSLIWQLVNEVSQDSLKARLQRMVAFRTRYATTDSCRNAVNWMRRQFQFYGCDSTFLDTFSSSYAPNVVGVRTGKVNPRHIFVVTGHIDNTSETPDTFAPGSDDNASGSGLVIEAARVFAGVDFDNTVWFVGFSAEEQGLVGSDSFVHACRLRGDSIIAAFHSDMISYGRDDSLTVVHTTALPQTESLAQFFLAQADTFTSLQVKDTVVNEARSDHYSFWKYGYLAIRGRFHDETPMYHTTGDTIGPFHYVNCGTNNLPLYTEMVKAAVATVAKWAGASPRVGFEESHQPEAASAKLVVAPSIGRAPICIRLSSAAFEVSVYNSAGRLVRKLGAGKSLSWDGCDFSGAAVCPGVYYFRTAGSSSRFVLAE
jgi:hypothetical protein